MGKGNFFLEVQSNSIPEQALVNKTLVEMSQKLDLPLIATNDSHYMKQSDAGVARYTSLRADGQPRLRRAALPLQGNDYYFRSPEEMWGDIRKRPFRSRWSTRSASPDRCSVKLKMGHYYLPEFPLPEGETLTTHLRRMAAEGLRRRLKTENPPQNYLERLEYELDIIEQMDFPGYFA